MAKIISSIPSGISIHNNLSGLNDGDFIHLTALEKNKLDGIETGAQVNINQVSQTITDGVTDKAPSENIVHDKLLLKQNLPTGFVQGLALSIHPTDNTKAIIATGGYLVTDFSDVLNIVTTIVQVTTPIEFTPAYLLTNPSTYIALDINQNIISSASPFDNQDRRTLCLIGNVVHSNNININVVNEIKAPILAPTNQLHDFIKAVGFLNLEGNLFTANGANLSLDKSAGKVFGLGINSQDYTDPHRLTLPQQTALTFRYRLSNSTEFSNTTLLDPTQYESSPGVLTSLTNNNRWSTQRVNIFQSGAVRIQPAQHEHNSFVSARNAAFTENFITESNISDNAIFRCYIIMKKTCTNLALDIANGDAEILTVGKFGNAIGGSNASLTLANILTVLGYTPENVANKAIDFSTVNDTLYPSVQATKTYADTKVPQTRTLTINGVTYDLSADRSWTISGSSSKKQFVISKDYQFAGSATFWCGLSVDDAAFANSRMVGLGTTTLVGMVRNDISPLCVVPFDCKLIRVDINILNANGGIYSVGVIKYNRANAQAFYGTNGTNQAVLLDQPMNSGVATGNQLQYQNAYTTEIASTTILTGEDVIVLMKSSANTIQVEFNITLTFEEI